MTQFTLEGSTFYTENQTKKPTAATSNEPHENTEAIS